MLGWAPIGWRPIAMLLDMSLPIVVAVPAGPSVLNYTLELYPSGGTPVRAAMLPFITLPSDTLSNTTFEGRLSGALTFNQSIINGDTIGGKVSASYGHLELANPGEGSSGVGRYDAVYENNTIDGRRLVLKYGQINVSTGIPASYDTYYALLDGIAQDWELDDEVLRITIRDNGFKLDGPASTITYAGTGSAEGPADLAGKTKPLAFGIVNNMTPAQINAGLLIYQVHNGNVNAIPSVYDSGYALPTPGTAGPDGDYASYAALAAATLNAGHYATCKALGLFRLGSSPNGLVTCDVQGDSAGAGGYITTTAAIARRLIALSAPLIDLVDEGAFTALAADQPAAVGYYLGLDDSKTVRGALDDLMLGIGGWIGFRRDGVVECGRFIAPTGAALDTFTTADIVDGTLQKISLPSGINPPPKRIRVAYSPIWTVQTDVVAGVSDARKQILKTPYSVAEHSNTSLAATIAAAHFLAKDPDVILALFNAFADAVAEANRLLSLWGVARRALYSFTDKSGRALVRKIGDVVTLIYPRFDLAAGKLGVIVGLNVDTDDGTVEVTVFV